LTAEAVLCVECGYDLRLGKSRATVVQKLKREGERVPAHELVSGFPYVLLGLTFRSASILLGLLGGVAITGVTMYAAAKHLQPGKPMPVWFSVLILAGLGLWLLGVLFGLGGSVLCLGVPRQARCRLLLVLTLTLEVATLPLGVIAELLHWTPLLALAGGICSWIIFIAFLSRLAAYVERPTEAREARTALLYASILVAAPVGLATALAWSDPGDVAGPAVALILFVSSIAYGRVQYGLLGLLQTLRESLRMQIDQAKREVQQD
jgi:hypothetical protein